MSFSRARKNASHAHQSVGMRDSFAIRKIIKKSNILILSKKDHHVHYTYWITNVQINDPTIKNNFRINYKRRDSH